MISNYIALTKPKIIVLLLITAVGGLFLASDGVPGMVITISVIIGGSLAAGGANALNHYIDRDIDLKMKRTSNRPVASGTVKPVNALLFGILLNLVAFGVLWQWANLISALLTLSATLFYIFIYTFFKRNFFSYFDSCTLGKNKQRSFFVFNNTCNIVKKIKIIFGCYFSNNCN